MWLFRHLSGPDLPGTISLPQVGKRRSGRFPVASPEGMDARNAPFYARKQASCDLRGEQVQMPPKPSIDAENDWLVVVATDQCLDCARRFGDEFYCCDSMAAARPSPACPPARSQTVTGKVSKSSVRCASNLLKKRL